MKKNIQLILTSFILVFVGMAISACDGEDWHSENTVLTDASHGSLTNHYVVATGEVKNVTANSATILFSANYNYKEKLSIKPGIVYTDVKPQDDYYLKCGRSNTKNVEINNFNNSACEITINNLKPSTTYFYRAYAIADGRENYGERESYGEIKSFRTSFDPSIVDVVDLGLSVKWASLNIGASQPEDSGDGFYWGGTEASEIYYKADWHDFSLSTLKNKGYIDSNNNLCPAYDAATQIWGNKWRMPTKDEFQELISKCSWNKTTKNGKDVYLITGPNSNIIYLPCCDHWTSTCNSSYAYLFYSYSYYRDYSYRIEDSSRSRSYVYSIRPVQK